MKNAIIFVIALAVSGIALAESPANIHGKYAAPFGLEWGLTKEKLAEMGVKLTLLYPDTEFYEAKNLPKNLSDADRNFLRFKQGFGLIEISAITKDITGDLDGSKGKERYRQLKMAIVNKYGKPNKEVERIGGTDVYKDKNHFYQCLHSDGCGFWVSLWGSKTDGYIALSIETAWGNEGYVSLSYKSAALHIAAEQEAEEQIRSDEDAL